jgi:cytidylate kinase
MKPVIVAIDGPSGAGKGTVARAVARALGYRHVDTGAMYRAVAWRALRDGLSLDDERGLTAVARKSEFDLGDRVRIDGVDVTVSIRTPEIDSAAAAVARLPAVRAALVDRQRGYAGGSGLVMEGRDIGTVVFPGADVKIYLDALPEERARRRANDPAHASDRPTGVDAVARALESRDRSDRTREASPLAIAPDATIVDTTDLTIEDVIARVLTLVRVKGGNW